jgi:hypothetical protein
MTVSDNLRMKFLNNMETRIPEVREEEYYNELKNFEGKIGLPKKESEAPSHLDKYFDSLLPKTAGGLWHELLVYIYMLRNNFGYIIPLLLSQRLISLNSSIVPPDFLILSFDKRIYGVEVGMKKEIQSGTFSLQTAIPTATIDTINSRASDRCPICKKWIPFCEFVIEKYSNFNKKIENIKIKCLEECNIYSSEEIADGACAYTKYSRNKAISLEYAQHQYATGLHYHYKCVLNNLSQEEKEIIVDSKDRIALITHYPDYSGLKELIKKKE